MTSEDRLREYVEKDEIYQKFINGILKANDMSDFDKFCVQHCKDIEELLDQKTEWIELIGKFKNQQKKFINYLISLSNGYSKDGDGIKETIINEILQKYKEIVNGTEQT